MGSIVIGSGVSIKDLHKTTIEGGKAPELDCQQFELRYSTNIIIHAIKCKLLRITTCENITITGSLIDEIEVNNSKKILFAGSTIKKEPKITDSDVDYSMCIINLKSEGIENKKAE